MVKGPSLLQFLRDLKAANIYFRLDHCRDDTILVDIAVPGERWEVEFFEDGLVDVEVFRSTGDLRDATALAELFEQNAD